MTNISRRMEPPAMSREAPKPDRALSIDYRKLGTVLAALKWWRGRSGKVPFILQNCFEKMPPLSQEELDELIAQVQAMIDSNTKVLNKPSPDGNDGSLRPHPE